MFREMRRFEKALSKERCDEILSAAQSGVLSANGANGYPVPKPLNYYYDGSYIYFHSAREGEKVDNIEASSKVSFCVIDHAQVRPQEFDTCYESVIAYGNCNELTNEADKKAVLMGIIEKYSLQYLLEGKAYVDRAWNNTRIYKISIEHMTGKVQN